MAASLDRNLVSLVPVAIWTNILLLTISSCMGAQVKVDLENDISRPTFGIQGPLSSQITYDNRNGLNMKGTINDILGPPLKIANGLGQLITGSNMAGVGQSLKTGSAMLGFNANLLESLGGNNLVRDGMLQTVSGNKDAAANSMAEKSGRPISNVIEMPVRVVPMRDLGIGSVLHSLGQVKSAGAQAGITKGDSLAKDGLAIRNQAIQQIMQGASEGVANIGNFFQQTAGNAATAIRALPIILDMQTPTSGSKGPIQQQQQQQEARNTRRSDSGPTGGSPFGGLNTLMGSSSSSTPTFGEVFLGGATGGTKGSSSATTPTNPFSGSSPFNLFGNSGSNHFATNNNAYAALLNATSPFMNLLTNPALNPFVIPLAQGPLGQSMAAKGPIGATSSSGSGSGNINHFGIFPFLRVTEQYESSPFQRFFPQHQTTQTTQTKQQLPQQQQQHEQQHQEQQHQTVEQSTTKSTKS